MLGCDAVGDMGFLLWALPPVSTVQRPWLPGKNLRDTRALQRLSVSTGRFDRRMWLVRETVRPKHSLLDPVATKWKRQ